MRRPRRRQQQLFPPSSPPHRRGNYKLIPSATFYPVDRDRCFSPVKAKSPPSHYSGFVCFVQWLGGKYLICKVDCFPLLKLLHSSANPTCRHRHQPLFRPHGLVRTVAAVTVLSDLQNRGKVNPPQERQTGPIVVSRGGWVVLGSGPPVPPLRSACFQRQRERVRAITPPGKHIGPLYLGYKAAPRC